MYREEIKNAIEEQLHSDFWDEAKRLVLLASDGQIIELMAYHKADKGNIFCLCLDKIKDDLLIEGKISKDDYPNFGLTHLLE